jgi:hypothetical protein
VFRSSVTGRRLPPGDGRSVGGTTGGFTAGCADPDLGPGFPADGAGVAGRSRPGTFPSSPRSAPGADDRPVCRRSRPCDGPSWREPSPRADSGVAFVVAPAPSRGRGSTRLVPGRSRAPRTGVSCGIAGAVRRRPPVSRRRGCRPGGDDISIPPSVWVTRIPTDHVTGTSGRSTVGRRPLPWRDGRRRRRRRGSAGRSRATRSGSDAGVGREVAATDSVPRTDARRRHGH